MTTLLTKNVIGGIRKNKGAAPMTRFPCRLLRNSNVKLPHLRFWRQLPHLTLNISFSGVHSSQIVEYFANASKMGQFRNSHNCANTYFKHGQKYRTSVGGANIWPVNHETYHLALQWPRGNIFYRALVCDTYESGWHYFRSAAILLPFQFCLYEYTWKPQGWQLGNLRFSMDIMDFIWGF